MVKDLSAFAQYDPAFACDGLFVPRSQKGWAMYDVGKEFNRGDTKGEIKFNGVQLTAAHQSILLAVCARTGRDGLSVLGTQSDLKARQSTLEFDTFAPKDDADVLADMLYEDINAQNARAQNTSIVEVSAYSLMADADLDAGGNGYKRMIKLMQELSSASVYRRIGKRGGMSWLVSFKHDADQLKVMVNWRLASAILGGGQFTRISLYERNDLKTAAAKILHAWLCCHLRPGTSFMGDQGVSIDALIPHIWGKRPASSKAAVKKRRAAVKDALIEIGSLGGWAITDGYRRGLVHISRPKDPYAHEPVEKWAKTPGIFKEEVGD